MSASEKLKALKAPAPATLLSQLSREEAGTMALLVTALPQIVAVVEAAETHAGDFHADEPFTGVPLHADLAAALSALEEAL